MATDLAIYERALAPQLPVFAELLGPVGMRPERLIRTVMISVERTPKLRECSMESIVMGATTFAVLGLEVDGVTGQGYLVPFASRAQPLVGYKGYNTLAHRAGITITGAVIREGDEFDYQLGTGAFIHHKPRLNGGTDRSIVAAWATATAPGKSPVVSLLDREQLMAIKAKSPGARKSDSPWNDPTIGFPAMCEKSAKRRLARSLPLVSYQQAAAVETHFEELGRPSYLRADGNLVGGSEPIDVTAEDLEDRLASIPSYPMTVFAKGGERTDRFDTLADWQARWRFVLERYQDRPEILQRYREANVEHFAAIGEEALTITRELTEAINRDAS